MVLDVTPALGKVRNRVQRVGLELEGGWTKSLEGLTLVRDGSIEIPSTDGVKVGELPSPPMELIKLKPFLSKYYPQVVHPSCGLHVHMSFSSSLNYSRLVERDYVDTLIAQLAEWAKDMKLEEKHPIWKRLAGKNQYCTLDFYPDAQINATRKTYGHDVRGNRYTAVNFCHGLNGTVECRVLPMFEIHQVAFEAIMRVVDVTNAFLVSTAKRERKQKLEVVHEGAEKYEEFDRVSI